MKKPVKLKRKRTPAQKDAYDATVACASLQDTAFMPVARKLVREKLSPMKKPVKLKRPRTPAQEDAVDRRTARERLSHWNEVERRRSNKLGEVQVDLQAARKELRRTMDAVERLQQAQRDAVLIVLALNESGTAKSRRELAVIGPYLRAKEVPSTLRLERGEKRLTFRVQWYAGMPSISPKVRASLQEWFR